MSRHNRFLCLIAATLVACNPSTPAVDGGPTGDTGATDTGATGDGSHDSGGGGASVCDSAMAVTLAAGAHSVMGDTTGQTTGVVDLGAMCGATAAGGTTAPQQVIAITLPGTATDTVAVNFTMRNTMTNMMFDTTTQLRANCTDATGAMCFDDNAAGVAGDYRSAGSFTAPGGSTRFLIVGGYRMPLMGYVNVGPWQVDFQTFLNPHPPTFTSGTAHLVDGELLTVEVMGMDPQSAATGLLLSFLDSTGTPIGFDTDMMAATAPITDFPMFAFRPAVTGMMTFDGTTRITGFTPFPQALTATHMRVSITDAAGLMSTEAMIPLVLQTTVHVGATCDATHVCPAGIDCTASVCTVPAAVATECSAATALTIATPTTTMTTTTTTVNYTTGVGLLEGSCMGTGGMGDEHIYTVTVPAGGPFDLVASTPPMGAMGPDTLLYDRTVCGDPSTETACNDDSSAMPHVIAAAIEVLNAAPGTHFIVADIFDTQTMAMSSMLTVGLRPVLASAAVCDPMGVMNRCHAAACPTTGTAVCP